MQKDLSKTLERLENNSWGEPTFSSPLVTRCYELRRKRLKDFSIGDLRLMIGQNISLAILIPLAINELRKNVLAEGDYYPGDLLQSVLRSEEDYWQKNEEQWRAVRDICDFNKDLLKSDDNFKIMAGFERFSLIHRS